MHFVSKMFILFFCLTLPEYVLAKDKGSVALGLFNEPEGDRFGAEAAITYKSDYFGGKLSGVLYGSNDLDHNGEANDKLYTGIAAFGFVHFGQEINPFLGLGVFIGENISCSDTDKYTDKCSTKIAIYPELGVEINISSVVITPYIRRYFDSSSSKNSDNVYGINFGLIF